MKIIEIIYSLSSGGAERFVVDLSNEFVAKGNDVLLCTLLDDKKNNRAFYKFELNQKIEYVNLGYEKLGISVSIRPRACFSPSYNKVKSQTCFVWLLTLL